MVLACGTDVVEAAEQYEFSWNLNPVFILLTFIGSMSQMLGNTRITLDLKNIKALQN